MLEKYLSEVTYDYEIYTEFTKNDVSYIVASEFSPTNIESSLFILYEKNNAIYNCNGNICAIIIGNKIKTIEE